MLERRGTISLQFPGQEYQDGPQQPLTGAAFEYTIPIAERTKHRILSHFNVGSLRHYKERRSDIPYSL